MALAELTEPQTQPLPTPCPPQDLLLQQMAEQGGGQTPPPKGPCPAPGEKGGGPPAWGPGGRPLADAP